MRKYVGGFFLKPDDLKQGPIHVTIAALSMGKYERPDLEFDDGSRLSLNATNARVLARAYGYESDDYIGKRIELTLGEVEYQGWMQESILIRPISPPVENKALPKSDTDDHIPF
jgi:hypothetical protein